MTNRLLSPGLSLGRAGRRVASPARAHPGSLARRNLVPPLPAPPVAENVHEITGHRPVAGSPPKEDALVTVIVAGYNQSEFLPEAVESVLGQTYRRIEVIVVDNGSTDDTPSVLEPLLGQRGLIFQHYDENGPITKRLNAAVKASTGDFISLLYADDIYLPGKIERQIAAFSGLPIDYGVVYSPGYRRHTSTGQQWLDGTIEVTGDALNALLLGRGSGRFINPISPLVRRECFEMHPFYEDLFVEGENHYLRVATTHRLAFLPEPLVVMREHDQNMGKAIQRNLTNIDETLKRLAELPSFPADRHGLLRRSRAQLYRNVGWITLRLTGDRRGARACLREAAILDWREAFHPRTVFGYTIATLPDTAVTWLNVLGYRLRRNKESTAFKDEY